MDTKYWLEAIAEFNRNVGYSKCVVNLTTAEFSQILRRAQELKDADKKENS